MNQEVCWIFKLKLKLSLWSVMKDSLGILELKRGGPWKFSTNNGTIIELEEKNNAYLEKQI